MLKARGVVQLKIHAACQFRAPEFFFAASVEFPFSAYMQYFVHVHVTLQGILPGQ